MKRALEFVKFFPLFVGLVFLTGCGQGLFNQTNTLELTQTHEFTDFGFSVDYPDGWTAETRGPITVIIEDPDDREIMFGPCCGRTSGIGISFDHRKITQLESWGLPKDASLSDLLQFNINEISGMSNPEISEATIFGVPAVQAKFYEAQWYLNYAGFIKDEAFIFGYEAPSEEMRDGFLPTWELMLASITPIE
jgi:hypothetical protein